jgi:tRNA-dependent cyclodipeptide synthase
MSGLFSINTLNEVLPIENQSLNTHKASFRSELQIDNKSEFFKGKKAILFISVGQAYHEGGKFLSTIELVNKFDFKCCDIMMADTLQKHNFMGAMGVERAYEYTRKAGDLWLERNRFALEQLAIEHSITRWDDLLSHKDYSGYRKLIDEQYVTNPAYRETLTTNANVYIDRLKAINPDVEEDELFKNGLEYLIEEMPIVMPMWANMGYEIIIYPKPLTVGMQKTYEIFVKDSHPGKCQWVYMRFKKNKTTMIPRINNSFETESMVV